MARLLHAEATRLPRWSPDWCRDVANASVEMVAKDAAQNMVVETSHGQLRNKILNTIKKNSETAHRDLYHSINSSIRGKKDFDSTIEVLEEGGIINVRKELPPGGGRPKIFYSIG
jgi:hypothetical protein